MLIPIRRAFQQIAISNATGYRLIKAGALGPIVKIGRRSLIRISDLDAFVARQERAIGDAKMIAESPEGLGARTR